MSRLKIVVVLLLFCSMVDMRCCGDGEDDSDDSIEVPDDENEKDAELAKDDNEKEEEPEDVTEKDEEPDESETRDIFELFPDVITDVTSDVVGSALGALGDLIGMIVGCEPLSSQFSKCIIANTSRVFEKDEESDAPIPDVPPVANDSTPGNLTALINLLISKPLIEGAKFYNTSDVE